MVLLTVSGSGRYVCQLYMVIASYKWQLSVIRENLAVTSGNCQL